MKKNILNVVMLGIAMSMGLYQMEAQVAMTSTANSGAAFQLEKMYLQTDKQVYLAGEVMWYNLFYYSAADGKPLDLSKVAYVELLDRDGKPVLQAKTPITGPTARGSFYLPVSLRSDHYILRVYTSWMRNGEKPFYYELPVTVINTVNPDATAPTASAKHAAVTFFPESGYLVQQLESKIVIRLTGGDGKPAAGFIVNKRGDTIRTISIDQHGIGELRLKPVNGESYSALVTTGDGTQLKAALSDVKESGYAMRVTKEANRYKVSIIPGGNAGQNGEAVSLVGISPSGITALEKGIAINGRELVFYVETSRLATGINQLVLTTGTDGTAAAYRNIYKPAPASAIRLSTSKDKIGTRVQGELTIDPKGLNGDSLYYSVAITREDPVQFFPRRNFANWQYLLPGLQASLDVTGSNFSISASEQDIDNMLIVMGQSAAAGMENGKVKHLPEVRGHLITGRVTRKDNGAPVSGIVCVLSVPLQPLGFFTGRTNNEGIVQFDVTGYRGDGEVVIRTAFLQDRDLKVELLSPFAEQPLGYTLPVFTLPTAWEEELLERSIGMQARNVYFSDSLKKFRIPAVTDTLPFYGKPEYRYYLDDYKRFNTMEEILREYVSPVNVLIRNGKLQLGIVDALTRLVYDANVLVLLDGVPLSDPNSIFKYDPMKVKKLEVVTRRYTLGPASYDGILNFQTFQGKFDAFNIDSTVTLQDYEGLQVDRDFYTPVYAAGKTGNQRLPDTRTTLQWIPAATTATSQATTIPFFTSDVRGTYKVVVEGISSAGEKVSATHTITVE